MDREKLQALADKFSDQAVENYITEQMQGSEGYVGYRLYQRPIFSIGRADDPKFKELLKPEVVGAHFRLPEYWLSGAKTIISFFSPTSEEVKRANRQDREKVALPWLMARVEGQEYQKALAGYLAGEMNKAGIRTAVPLTDERFFMRASKFEEELPVPPFSCNWSERLVAYICGLGTFGMAYNIITKKGTSGRFFSLITDWDVETDERPYTGIYDYCNQCGACIKRCPGDVIQRTHKDVRGCGDYMARTGKSYLPRYGCGKCQVGVPCQDGIPKK